MNRLGEVLLFSALGSGTFGLIALTLLLAQARENFAALVCAASCCVSLAIGIHHFLGFVPA